MRKYSLPCLSVFASLLLTVFCNAQQPIQIGQRLSFFSGRLKENRQVWIYTPEETATQKIKGKTYPVLYLLDGDAHFYSVVGMIQQLSQANMNAWIPEMIVVGLPNTNRLRDLSPAPPSDSNFTAFLEKELIPFVEKQYPAAPYRLLMGHSLGGLMAIDILANRPDLFQASIAIDPSIWYYNAAQLRKTKEALSALTSGNRTLFIAIANTLPKELKGKDFSKDRSPATQHIRSIYAFDAYMQEQKIRGIRYQQQYYEKENHQSVPLIAGYDALRFVFDFYAADITEKDFLDTSDRIVNLIRSHYQTVSNRMGYRNHPPESFLRYLAFDALDKRQYAKSDGLFNYNAEAYPSSAAVYRDYGEYYGVRKDTLEAIAAFRKSLQIESDEATQLKIKSLQSPQPYRLSAEAMQEYTGTYTLESYEIKVQLLFRSGKLWSRVPGQPDGEMIPLAADLFTVRGKTGYRILFLRKSGSITGFTADQPNGLFKATRL